jgi:hypothetical protein
VLHYQRPERNAALVKKAASHLRRGGRLFIKDRFLNESRTGPPWVTAFAVHILINTDEGRCYTVSEAVEWMKQAGLQVATFAEGIAVVEGAKP